jgi:peptide/nickel transport system substrate-binding protein
MKRFRLIWLVLASWLWAISTSAADRPHYGGTLHVEMHEGPQILDPLTLTEAGPQSLARSVFETLTVLDEFGRPQPRLAVSWQAEPGNQRWRFLLRDGVSFSDGIPLDAASVAAALRISNPDWKTVAAGNLVLIETPVPDTDVPGELALVRHSIVRRSDGGLVGTGPFVLRDETSEQQLTLKANEQYWAGRPFLDSIEVEFGKTDRDQLTALDLGKADLVEVPAENIRREEAENRNVITSPPDELVILVFASDARSESELRARNALALSIDSEALNNVVVQGGGQPSAALLPQWLSGYAFLFAQDQSTRSRPLPKQSQSWSMSFDQSSSVDRVIAERVVLNARDVGITLQLGNAPNPDLRLLRIPLASIDAHVALSEFTRQFELPRPRFSSASVADLYLAERSLLESHRFIPLLQLRRAITLAPGVHDVPLSADGTWHLENAWIAAERP